MKQFTLAICFVVGELLYTSNSSNRTTSTNYFEKFFDFKSYHKHQYSLHPKMTIYYRSHVGIIKTLIKWLMNVLFSFEISREFLIFFETHGLI